MSASPSVASVLQTVNGSFVRPTYSALSNDLLVGLLTAASAIPDLQSPVGEAFAMMLADRVPALEVLAGSTILVPVNPPIENQEINFTFMSSCPVAFLMLRGRPGVFNSFAEVIGFTNDIDNHPLAIGLTVQFPTPEWFIVAKGDLLASCQLRAAATTEPDAKRLKTAQLVGGGELTSLSGERAILYITDLDGGKHATRNKTELANREKDMYLGFRVVEPARWPHLMGGGLAAATGRLCQDNM